MIESPLILFDNGAYTIKAEVLGIGGSKNVDKKPKLIYNALSKSRFNRRMTYVGNEFLDDLNDFSGLSLQFCYEKGYLCDWNSQVAIWRHIFKNDLIECNGSSTTISHNTLPKRLMMTTPVFNFKSISENMIEIFFEDFELSSLSLMTAPILAHYRINPLNQKENTDTNLVDNRIVVDSGFSFTHIIPIINNKIYNPACIRIDIGGKLLTNYLGEIISYRHINLLGETYITNQIKEDCCYCSNDFMNEINSIKKNKIKTYYQLPNYNTINRGRLLDHNEFLELRKSEQILQLSNEPIVIPELLFKPSDIGLNQMGIGEAIYTAINNCPPAYHTELYKNIILIGGNMKFKNIKDRICSELESLKPEFLDCSFKNFYKTNDPITCAWYGGKDLLTYYENSYFFLSKSKYKELGVTRSFEFFNSLNYSQDPY